MLRADCTLQHPTAKKLLGYGDRKFVDCSAEDTSLCGCRADGPDCKVQCVTKLTYEPCAAGSTTSDCECPAQELSECQGNKISVCGERTQCKNMKRLPCQDDDELCLCTKFRLPRLMHRKKWTSELYEELGEAYQSDKWSAEFTPAGTTVPQQKGPWKTLHDQGIEVGFLSIDFVTSEIERIIEKDLDSLGGTFVLMICFLYASIGISGWNGWKPIFNLRRLMLSFLVILQPFLAFGMSLGIGSIAMWKVPGDVDLDGFEDEMLAFTSMSPITLHLLLGIIVDLDIILVRSFDGLPDSMPLRTRFEVAVGMCHRTVSISSVCGLMAYALGSMVELQILIFFCWQSFLGYIGLYITLFTVFLGAFVLSEGGSEKKYEVEEKISDEDYELLELDRNYEPFDLKFAAFITNKFATAFFMTLEILFLIFIFVFVPKLSTVGNDVELLLDDSLIRIFFKHVTDAGGLPQQLSLWMPNSDIGQYHKRANRKYYFNCFEEVRKLDATTPYGIPGTYSWLHEFEYWNRGGYAFSDTYTEDVDWEVAPPTRDPYGSWAVPLTNICPVDYALNVAATASFTSGSAGTVTGVAATATSTTLDALFAKITLNRRFEFAPGDVRTIDFSRYYAEQPTEPLNFEIVQITKGGDILLSVDPRRTEERLTDYTSVAALKTYRATQYPFTIEFRDRTAFKYSAIPNLSGLVEQCPIHQSYYSQRVKFHETNPGDFYEYLYDFFFENNQEDWCGISELINTSNSTSIMSKSNRYRNLGPGQCGLVVHSEQLQTFENIDPIPNAIRTPKTATSKACNVECDDYRLTGDHTDPANTTGQSGCLGFAESATECIIYILTSKEKVNKKYTRKDCANCQDYTCSYLMTTPHASLYWPLHGNNIEWLYDKDTLRVTGIKQNFLAVFSVLDLQNMEYLTAQRKETLDLIAKWKEGSPLLWPDDTNNKGMETFMYAEDFITVERDESILHQMLTHFGFVSIAVVASCILLLHPIYGIAVGIFLATINAQVLAIMAMVGLHLDGVSFGVIAMAIGFSIEYVVHIAHAFIHCKHRGLERTKKSLEEMGVTVFAAFLSTAVQQFVFLIFADSLLFTTYCQGMLIVLIKSGISGFFFVPTVLGLIDEVIWRLQGRPEPDIKRSKALGMENVAA